MKTDSVEDDWDSHWDQFAASASENPAQSMRHAIIASILSDQPHVDLRRVLDIGSGQGDLVQRLELQMPEAEFLGIELSQSGVDLSRKKTRRARFVTADLADSAVNITELNAWATDAVCSEVLEHLDQPVQFLRNIKRYLAPGGRLVVSVPGGPMSAFDRTIGHRRHFTRDSLASLLEDAGFAVETVRLAGFPFFNLYRLVVIARGDHLARDVSSAGGRFSSRSARAVMTFFRFAFRFCVRDSRFGWQVIAVARNNAS